jgi:hypothetical protein
LLITCPLLLVCSQILSRTNPLSVPGLNLPQSVLFFEALAHHWLAIATVALG